MTGNKQQREAKLFQRFAQAYPLPEGRIDHRDRPDFRVHTHAHGILGIEVTELYQESGATGPQGQEVERAALLDAARQRCIAAGVPPVDVRVFFAPDVRLGKTNRAALATQIASLVETRMPTTNAGSIHMENLWRDPAIPECVLSVRITRLPWLERHHWSAPEAGWVQLDCIGVIQSSLDAKAAAYVEYRKECGECWLLIGASGWRPSSLFTPSHETLQHQYKSPFQKVFLIEHFSGSVKELSRVS